jgi:ABC-type dipeptide/oligopeptide/nickel transport system ATPase component
MENEERRHRQSTEPVEHQPSPATPAQNRPSSAPAPAKASDDDQEPAPDFKVYLGEDRITSKPIFWDPATTKPKRLLNQHLLIVGKSGSGKSETTKSLLYELDQRGVPAIIFDFQGEYATGEFAEAVKPQVFDVMEGLPINPFEIPLDPRTGKRRRPVEMMFRLADTLNTVFSGSGDIQLGKLRDAIEECYKRCGFDMQEPAPEDKEAPTLELLEAVLESWGADRGGQIKNLQVRLQPLFKSGIFVQGKASFSFDDLFRKTSVILLTAGIKDLMLAASRFLLEKVYAAMMMQGMSKKLKLIVSVDEAHKLCNDPKITDLAKEARKYGLGLVLSSQETRDFHPSIFANAGTQIVLALEDADATVMSKVYATEKKDQAAVKNLIIGQESGVALIRSTHFWPYQQVRIKSFEDRVEEL